MSLVIVLDYISDGINALLDKAIADFPAAAPDRDYLFGVILNHVDRTGKLPETFELKPRAEQERGREP